MRSRDLALPSPACAELDVSKPSMVTQRVLPAQIRLQENPQEAVERPVRMRSRDSAPHPPPLAQNWTWRSPRLSRSAVERPVAAGKKQAIVVDIPCVFVQIAQEECV